MTVGFCSVAEALEELGAGRAIVVVDEEERTNVGHVLFAGALATKELVAFTVAHGSGMVRVALPPETCARLQLPQMVRNNQNAHGTAFTVTVDARTGVSTGISAADRCHTIRLLSDPATAPEEFTRPGHVLPVEAHAQGVMTHPGQVEAAVDLTRLAGLAPSGVLCEIVSERDPRFMAGRAEVKEFCARHGLKLFTIASLVAHRRRTESRVRRAAQSRIPTPFGTFRAVGYSSLTDGREHVAFVQGDLGDGADVTVGLHSECITGDVFGSPTCGCRERLDEALRAIAAEGRGVVVYLRSRASLGDSLLHRPVAPHDGDTPLPRGDNMTAAHMLTDLGVRSVRLLSDGSVHDLSRWMPQPAPA